MSKRLQSIEFRERESPVKLCLHRDVFSMKECAVPRTVLSFLGLIFRRQKSEARKQETAVSSCQKKVNKQEIIFHV